MGNSELKETFAILFFVGIVSLGIMGFPSFMYHMTNSNAIEKFDVPIPEKYTTVLMMDSIPLTFAEYYVLEPPDPLFDLFGLIPIAQAEEQFIWVGDDASGFEVIQVRQAGTGSACPSITGPSSVTTSSDNTLIHWRTSSSNGCYFPTYTMDRTTTPQFLLPEFFNDHLTSLDFLNDIQTSGDTSFSSACRYYAISDALGENIDPRLNATAAYEVIEDFTKDETITSSFIRCDDGNAQRPELSSTTGADYLASMASNSSFYSFGKQVLSDDRAAAFDNTLTSEVFMRFGFTNPTNSSAWNLQEHPKFDDNSLTEGFFKENSGGIFNMHTTNDNSDRGQVVVFKEFNKTEVGTNDIRVTGNILADTSTSDMWLRFEVKDGDYAMGSDVYFPQNQYDIHQGNGSLGVVHIEPQTTSVEAFDISIIPNYADSTEDFFTVFIGIDDNSTSGALSANITSFEIDSQVKHDFTDIDYLQFYEVSSSSEADDGVSAGGSLEDGLEARNFYNQGIVNFTDIATTGVTGVTLPTPNPPTDPNATATSTSAIYFQFDHDFLNVTDFRLRQESPTGGGFGSPIFTNNLTKAWNFTGLSEATEYNFEVCAVNGNSTSSCVTDSDTTLSTPAIPSVINDLVVSISNTTEISDGGTSSGTVERVDLFPAYMLQTIPTPTNPTLIDSIRIKLDDSASVPGGTIGTIKAVIIGDKTGDIDFDSSIDDIFFIENSTQTVTSGQTYPATLIFNFSGNTILDSNDDDVAVGIVISNHTNQIELTMDNNDGTGIGVAGNALFLGNLCGSTTTFERDGCSDVDTSDILDLEIFGGNPRAVLEWSTPAGAPTGYEISIANATGTLLLNQRVTPSDTDFTHSIGTTGDNNGFAGQRVTFPNDVVINSMIVGLEDGGFPASTGLIQAVILKDAPDGTGAFTIIENSTKEFDLSSCCGAGELSQSAEVHANVGGSGSESFAFNNTVLTGGVEYIIGVRASGVTGQDGSAILTSYSDQDGGALDFTSLGNFTYLDTTTSDLWTTTNDEFSIRLSGYNYTTEVSDTGNTNTKYTSTANFPDYNEQINAYSYLVKGKNGFGTGNASNFVEISPDRSDSFDTWSFKEHDSRLFFHITCEYSNTPNPPFNFNVTETGLGTGCWMFKSFDSDLINGSDIRLVFNNTRFRMNFEVVDGFYDKDSKTDFPQWASRQVKGGGVLNQTDFSTANGFPFNQGDPPTDHTILASQIDYASSTEDHITLFFETRQSGFPGNSEYDMQLIEISNIGSWNFTQNPRIIYQVNEGRDENNLFEMNMDDRGTVQSKGVFNGTVQVVTPPATPSAPNPPAGLSAIADVGDILLEIFPALAEIENAIALHTNTFSGGVTLVNNNKTNNVPIYRLQVFNQSTVVDSDKTIDAIEGRFRCQTVPIDDFTAQAVILKHKTKDYIQPGDSVLDLEVIERGSVLTADLPNPSVCSVVTMGNFTFSGNTIINSSEAKSLAVGFEMINGTAWSTTNGIEGRGSSLTFTGKAESVSGFSLWNNNDACTTEPNTELSSFGCNSPSVPFVGDDMNGFIMYSGDVVLNSTATDYIVERNDGLILRLYGNGSSGWDVDTLSLNQTLSVTGEDTEPHDIFFKPDGLTMYMLGDTGNDIQVYTLTTPWDIGTASTSSTFSVASEDTLPKAMFFRPDGKKLYITGDDNDRIFQYSLSTAWDLSTATLETSGAIDEITSFARGLFFKPDGTKFYVIDLNVDRIYQWNMSNAWDINSQQFEKFTSVGGLGLSAPHDLWIHPNGTLALITDAGSGSNDDLVALQLSTPFDFTGASFITESDIDSEETSAKGMFMRNDGLKYYMTGVTSDNINEYDLDISTTDFTIRDSSVDLNTFYNYTVIATDEVNNLNSTGVDSNGVLSNDLPNTVTGISVMPMGGATIEISWIIPSDFGLGNPSNGIDPKEVVIFKENTTDASGFFRFAEVDSTSNMISDTVVDAGKNYTYKLAGQNIVGIGTNSSEFEVTTVDNSVVMTVYENDLTTLIPNIAEVTIDNGVDSETKTTNAIGKVNFIDKGGAFDVIVKETNDNFVINKTSLTFVGSGSELFDIQTNIFRVNCATNDPPTSPDIRIKVNDTDAHIITAFTDPVCVENVTTENQEITWDVTFTSDSASASIFESKMIADVLRTDTFGTGNEDFEVDATQVSISYNSGTKKLTSVNYNVGAGTASPTLSFFLELDEVPEGQGGGGDTGGGDQGSPDVTPPIPGGGGQQTTRSPAPFGEFQLAALSITSDTIFLIPGERVERELFIDWNVDDSFIITGVTVDDLNDRWFAFESLPKPFNSQGAFGTADLGFTIQLDPQYCNPTIGLEVNCVPRGVIDVPITVTGLVGEKPVSETHFIKIDTSERFGLSTFLIIFFVIFLVIALAVASRRASAKNNKKAKKTKPKEKQRVQQRKKKKGTTVQNLKSRR